MNRRTRLIKRRNKKRQKARIDEMYREAVLSRDDVRRLLGFSD